MINVSELIRLLPGTIALAKQAGDAILAIYNSKDTYAIEMKSDATPVTAADIAAHKIIAAGLPELLENTPVLSEESVNIPFSERQQWSQYWLVDPLDGTKEFIHRTDEFTVNIALIENHVPILGVVYIPVKNITYFAARDYGAYKQCGDSAPEKIHVRKLAKLPPTVTISRRHRGGLLTTFLTNLANYNVVVKGSSIKSCIIAAGIADVYPCLGATSEWDIAAAQCVVAEAGGAVFDISHQPLRYNTKASLINPPLLVVGDEQHQWLQYLSPR
jgi:3'(2'), 5'-bisphosphate nucleotidase